VSHFIVRQRCRPARGEFGALFIIYLANASVPPCARGVWRDSTARDAHHQGASLREGSLARPHRSRMPFMGCLPARREFGCPSSPPHQDGPGAKGVWLGRSLPQEGMGGTSLREGSLGQSSCGSSPRTRCLSARREFGSMRPMPFLMGRVPPCAT
jgi:hypothetical protein